ncbi:MAG: hypothetical protein PHO01_08485 [Desulfotomaculaceae bacterium]|nr:hypothetical protein [Desulfotomaculaceae bacterium]
MPFLQKYISIIFLFMAFMLLSTIMPGPATAADPGEVINKVAGDNLYTEDWSSSGAEPVPGGRFKFYSFIGDMSSGWVAISVDEPVDGATMQAVLDWNDRENVKYEVDYNVIGVTSMPGYELYEYTALDMAGVWFVLADYLIQVEIYDTGNDIAVDLQTAKNLAGQVMVGLQQKAPVEKPASVEQEKPPIEGEKAPAAAAPVTAKPLAEPVEVANTDNIAGVYNGPTAPTIFTINSPHLVTYIRNYHWNKAKGSTPGTIGLKDRNGKIYGPWQAGGTPGQGGVPNANWEVFPNIVIPAGTYTVIDSEPSTWAQNKESGGRGMGVVKATPHFEVDGVPAKGSTKNGPGSLPGSGGWVESPAGVGSVGNIPGPSNTTEALVGVAVPGLLATLLGAMAGLGGGGGGIAPPTITPVSPAAGGPAPGTGGSYPGTGTQSNVSPQEVDQLGRRRRGSQPAAAPTGPARPAPEADHLTMTNKGTRTQQGTTGGPEIFIDTVDMLDGTGGLTTRAQGKPSDKGIFIETAEEGANLIQPDGGAFIDPAAEGAVLMQDKQILQMDTTLEDSAEDMVLLDTSAFDEPVLQQDGVPLQEAETARYDESGFDAAGYDRDGFDKNGFDQEGFNKEGIDREGFNREGFDQEGFDRAGFDKEGYDKNGFDKEGFDEEGFDKEGFDRNGLDKDGFDKGGFNQEGFNREGFDKKGFDREGFDQEGLDRNGFDKNGFDKIGFNKEGFDKEGYNKEGFDQNGFDRKGFNKQGFDQEGFNRAGFDREGFDKNGFDQEGFDREGFNKAGFDKEGFDQDGFNKDGFDKQGFNKEGYNQDGFNKEGFDQEGFDQKGFDKEGFNRDGFDSKGFNREGFNKDGFDREGYGKNGFDREGYNREGYDVNGYDKKGYNRSGYDAKGYDRQGYDKAGFNKEGWDRDGYNRNGFNKEGYDRDGYDQEGFNREGCDRDGFDRQGRQREGYDQDGYDKNGFNRDGYDRDGFDRRGFDYEGYNRSGYDPWGYNRQGYGKDGYHWSGYNADGYNRAGMHWTENPYEGDSPFNVDTEHWGKVRSPFDGGPVIITEDNYGNQVNTGIEWKPTKPPLGEPYPKTVEEYGPKPWTDEIPQPGPEKPAVPPAEDTGVIGPEDPMNTLKNHEPGQNAPAAPEGQDGTGLPVPEEDIPGTEPGQTIPEQQAETGTSDTFTYTDPDTGETSTYEYEKGYTGPRHGDRQVLVGKSDGQTYELGFDAVKGKWINTESGNEFNPDDFDRWQNDLAEDRRRAAIDMEKMAKREDANSRAIDQNLDDWRKLEQMQKVADKYNIGEPGGPGDVDKAIEDLKKDMLAGKELDQEKMDKIRRVIDNRILGKTIADTGERWEEDWFKNLGWALEANAATAKEVITGEKADGSISWKGMAARIMITAATGGGASLATAAGEITRQGAVDGVLTVAEAMYRIKDSIDKGESDFRAVSKAIGLVVLGEEAGWLAGKAGGKLIGEMLEKFPVFTNKLADLIEKGALKVMQGDQLISKALGLVSKESAEETIVQINKRLADIGGEAAEEAMEKTAKGAGKAAAGATDDIAKGAKKVVTGGDDIAKGAGKAPASTGDDIAEGGGKAVAGSGSDAATKGEKATSGASIQTETPGLKIDNSSFKDAGLPPDLRGMPTRDQKAIQMVSDKYGVKAQMRPTNPESKRWLETGKAHPKPEMLKTKTINELDVELGYPKDYRGTVACKKPDPLPPAKPDTMSAEHWNALQKRHKQRMTEYTDQVEKLNHLEQEGKILWDKKTGIIYNGKTMKPYAGDHDAFAFVDAVSGKPVPPRVNQQLNRELQSLGATQHNEHVGWDYSGLPDQVPGGSPPGAQSPREIAEGIDRKILSGHDEGGEPLNTYDPLQGEKGGWTTSWWKGGIRQ